MRSYRPLCFCLISVIVCIASPDSSAEMFSLGPEADAFVAASNPDNNYGGAGAVGISAPGLPKGTFQGLFRFDLAGAKTSFDTTFGAGNWLLESAVLQLTATFPNNVLFNSSAAGVIDLTWMENDSWIEGVGTPNTPGGSGITWNTLPTFLSAGDESLGTMNFDGATTGTRDYPLAVSSGFSADLFSGGLASILLNAADGDVTVSALFNSRTFNNPASRPVLALTATAVPEPSLLFASGWAILLALRFRPKWFVH